MKQTAGARTMSKIKEWIIHDDEIKMLQQQIKEHKTEKKALTDNLVDIMKTNSIDCFEQKLFKKVDTHVNNKLTNGMKLAINLIVNKFDTHLENKLISMIKGEIDIRINELKDIN